MLGELRGPILVIGMPVSDPYRLTEPLRMGA